MSWPSPPLVNGQRTTINGIIYEYDSGNIVWNRVGQSIVDLPVSVSTVTASQQPNITSLGTLANLTVTANITSGNATLGNLATSNYFNGNGSLLTSLTGGNVTGQVGNALLSGTVYTNAQPNITSVGTLTSLTITGNVTSGNASLGNLITSNYYTGTLTTGAQPNITSTGTLTNLNVSGNLTVSGSFEYANVSTFRVKDPIIEQGGNTEGGALTSNDGYDRGQLLHYYTTAPVDAFMGYKNSSGEFIFASNASIASEVITVNTYGNIHAGNATFSNLVTSNYYTGTLTTGAQPNITSVGTLTALTVTGVVTATSGGIKVGNIQDPSGTNTIQLTSGSISVTGNITAGAGGSGNVTGTYLIGTLTTGDQPNITGIGTLTSLTITGNLTSGNANLGNLITSNYYTGTLTTNAQPNVTSVGSLSALTVAGNLTTQQSQEVFQTKTGATGTVVHDFSLGSTFFHTSISANFTANFTNIPSTSLRSTVAVLLLNQGVTPYYCNAVTINGSAQTIKWLNAVTPTITASRTEMEVLTFFNNAGTYTVTGSIVSYG